MRLQSGYTGLLPSKCYTQEDHRHPPVAQDTEVCVLGKMQRKLAPAGLLVAALVLGACGGGSSSNTPSSPALNPPGAPLVQVSGISPYGVNCGGAGAGSVSYEDAEDEPYEAVNPTNPSNIIGVWQQDRWSDGGAHGLVAGYSTDSGKTWHETPLVLSVCAGGNAGNGANYARASDPWVTFSPNGTAYIISISFSGNTLALGSLSAVLVTRSTDGGVTWSNPATLINDVSNAFNDKESITADPNNSNFVYAVWDRLDTSNRGPTMFARSIDGGVSWQPATPIYDPGIGNQTIGNEIVGLSNGTILDLFEEIDSTSSTTATSSIRVISSSDQGASWSAPVTVAANDSVGTFDPDTGNLVRAGSGLPQMAAGPGGSAVMVWQDGRFNGGRRDGIVLSTSGDGGVSWSQPVEINSVPAVPAFTPSVAVMPNGTIGVTYFDFRNNTPDTSTLPTDYWFTSSTDGVHWSEQHISGPFDLDLAPEAEGLFLGDYQSLSVVGNAFVPFYVQTTDQGTADRTNAYVLPPQPIPLTVTHQLSHIAVTNAVAAPDAAFRQRIHQNLMHLLRSENPGWDQVLAQRQKNSPP